jgi:hypothetical protein
MSVLIDERAKESNRKFREIRQKFEDARARVIGAALILPPHAIADATET